MAHSNPIHVVGPVATKELASARADALRPFHLGLDEAERNLHALLPAHWRPGPRPRRARFAVTDESTAFNLIARSVAPADRTPSFLSEPLPTGFVDPADQPA